MKGSPPITERELKDMFEKNFEHLRAENGHSLSPEVREAAWQQVRLYWVRLRHIAETVTDTEVELSLPNQKTLKGRHFCIEGVVDIVRESDRVTMYDIKIHDLEFVRSNSEFYEDQLNVYAYIWQQLRGQRLDESAIIATPPPDEVLDAVRAGDPARIEAACRKWDPVVPIPFDAGKVKKTVDQFARAVDAIEDHQFAPPTLETLEQRNPDNRSFAQRVCRNCDVRFSCASYRSYARKYKDRNWRKFASFYDAPADEGEEQDRVEKSLNSVASAMEAAADL
jgi:hypothetical protein